jgi:hypothetical protein
MATGIVVSDANGQPLAYTYFWRDENEVRQANVLTHDEARRIAGARVHIIEENRAQPDQRMREPCEHEQNDQQRRYRRGN